MQNDLIYFIKEYPAIMMSLNRLKRIIPIVVEIGV